MVHFENSNIISTLGPPQPCDLPRELLEVIFGFHLPQRLSDDNTSPALICLVCRDWQSIVLNWPPFWTVLKLRGKLLRSIATDSTSNEAKVLLEKWLGRSKGLAISLVLEVMELRDEEGVKAVLRMDSVSARLTSLTIAMNQLRYPKAKGPVDLSPDHEVPEFPSLRTFSLKVACPSLGRRWYGRRPITVSTLPQLLRRVLLSNPNLRNLHCQGLAFHLLLSDNPTVMETRWSSLPITPFEWGTDLTKIQIDTLQSTGQCLAILKHCKHLRVCQLGCLVWANEESSDSFPYGIVAHHLRQLSLKGNIHAEVFTSLSAPVLESLAISHTHMGLQPNFEADLVQPEVHLLCTLPDFLRRSMCPLEELSLIEVEFEAASFEHTLSSAPGLKILVIQNQRAAIPNSASVVDVLTPLVSTPIAGNICPNLRHLHFQSTEVPPEGLLSRLVSSRMGDRAIRSGVALLEDINFTFETSIHNLDLAFLRSCSQELGSTVNRSQCSWSFSGQ